MGLATVGASLVFVTVSVNVSDALPPLPSVAVTRIAIAPTLALAGVPEKVRVAALKLSHAGKAEPSLRVAVYARASPSTSAKALDGTWNENGASSFVVRSEIGLATVGASLVLAATIAN